MDLRATYNKIAKRWVKDHRGDTWWIGGFRVTGIDFSEKMIILAKERVPSGRFFLHDIRRPLDRKDLFDGVFAQAVLLHIPKNEIVGVLKKITAPLKSEGYLYVAVKELQQGGQEEAVVKENAHGYTYERFFSYFTLSELKRRVQEIGLKIVDENVTPSGTTNWIQTVAEKP